MKKIGLLLVICLILIPKVVFAQGGKITISNDAVVLSFPNSILFKTDLKSDAEITSVRLLYGTTQDTCGKVTAIAFPEFIIGKNVHAEWEWDMRQSGGEPPGATVWWQWEVGDSSGNTLLTEKKEITWLDNIHQWEELSQGKIRLHYYMGDRSFGDTLKDAAVSALNRLSKETGINPDQPIDLYIYGDNKGLRDAVLYEPGWTGGLAYAEYNIVIIGIAPANVEWGKRTVAHELTHVLVGDFTFSCLGAMPTWLVEGLAVYGEGGPESSGANYFEQNRSENTLLSFRVLSGGFSEDPNKANLSYSQSYYVVNYLIEKYGKDKLITFLGKLKTGGGLNESLQATYGFNLIGFENEWRASLNLPEVEESVTRATLTPTIIPTIIPIQGIQPASTISPQPVSPGTVVDSSSESLTLSDFQKYLTENNVQTIIIIILGSIFIVGIVLVALITMLIVRNRKAARQKGDLQ
ncbi:MAG: hypothetical protein FD147_317 [Chloroflexi bacterium]|nr:MAG: hypothetical protein FD147_317 [Chloroflexota bacterium]